MDLRPALTIAAIIALIGCLILPVSAGIISDKSYAEYVDTTGNATKSANDNADNSANPCDRLRFKNIQSMPELSYIILDCNGRVGVWKSNETLMEPGRHEFTYKIASGESKPGVVYVSHYSNSLGVVQKTRFLMFFNEWDIKTHSGLTYVTINEFKFNTARNFGKYYTTGGIESLEVIPYAQDYWVSSSHIYASVVGSFTCTWVSHIPWKNRVIVSNETQYGTELMHYEVYRVIDGKSYGSSVNITNGDAIIYSNSVHGQNLELWFPEASGYDLTSPAGGYYTEQFFSQSPGPDDPGDAILRTGTVTMTDNNGTTIRGFEVTAINAYTGENYTVSTESDIAVMTLPMDRTIQIRNPQTGVYEEAPIGYYRFYGQASGYKMLLEEGIQVAVMPEKYSSYQLCDILVTSESGYLTGNHQFQIRSRSDNTVLQTGTISAKSATTGEWYNTTVSGGIATLILPYDTSNTISQYAGNYYVYATSPGYEDSDYGTQIVVMPQTVSEIRTILLTPIGGIPPAGNVTLRIQAFSETGPGVNNAKIFIAGVIGEGASVWNTYTASSTGYLSVSVPGNSTYDIVASGDGYYDSARRVEVFTEDPPLIEIKLYRSGAPTVKPTSQPTGWPTPPPTPTPRPTVVAPGNSPIDNFILMFVNMGFDSAMALWLTGMFLICIAAVIGHLIAGRFGAMLGAPVGIVATTGLGLIPFWGMVILLVIAALVIAKMVMR